MGKAPDIQCPTAPENELSDVTAIKDELKKTKDQLLHAQKMEAIGTLAGGIAHDFNNILSGIMGYAQLAALQMNEPQKMMKNVEQIMKGAQRASSLVQQILTFSRQSETKPKPIKVSALLKETVKLLDALIPADIEIQDRILSDAHILADPTQIHQVIMNLCTNAYHAMNETGGRLIIELEEVDLSRVSLPHSFANPVDSCLKLRVQDTGRGIEKENLNKIFHPYFTTKEKGKGTGLGLSVVDGIVKQTQGMIKFDSAIGKGSWFEIYWPVHQPDSAFAAFGKREAVGFCNGNERIMFVDDEADILETSRLLLNHMGYMVEPFKDGWAALQHFTDNPDGFDLVITDLSMPKLSGDELATRILKINKGIPIILCTGYSEKFDMQQAYQIGIRKYLVKPVTSQQLSSSIREVMGAGANSRQVQIV